MKKFFFNSVLLYIIIGATSKKQQNINNKIHFSSERVSKSHSSCTCNGNHVGLLIKTGSIGKERMMS